MNPVLFGLQLVNALLLEMDLSLSAVQYVYPAKMYSVGLCFVT